MKNINGIKILFCEKCEEEQEAKQIDKNVYKCTVCKSKIRE
jgi:ribosomal protein L37AE/L43A